MQPYGGFWVRVLAYLIDWFILQFATSMLAGVVVAMALVAGATSDAGDTMAVGMLVALYGSMLVANWLYFAIMESSRWQGTVGKQALKLIVTDEHGERIGFGRATGRYFAKILSSLILSIGFFMVGWTERKQGLHDMIAGTLVQRANSPFVAANSARVFE
jgi:uncharacterized RDD family membrane protein YckC